MPIEYTREDAVGYISLNLPPGNNYEIPGMEELSRAIDTAANDSAVRSVVLRSAIRAVFSLGADIGFLANSSVETTLRLTECAHTTLCKIAAIPKPFIAMIEGHALGGGFEIALGCDFRFAAAGNYQIGLPEAGLGLMPGNGGTQRLARMVGPTKALELMFSAKRMRPEEAHQMGLVDRVLPAAEVAKLTHEYAAKLAQGADLALGAIKLSVWQGIELSLHDGLKVEKQQLVRVLSRNQFQEGVRAFLEKRPPDFHNRQ